jgi:hypothetical protein
MRASGDTAACLLFIHHTAAENAATATTSMVLDCRSSDRPPAGVKGVAGLGISWDALLAG